MAGQPPPAGGPPGGWGLELPPGTKPQTAQAGAPGNEPLGVFSLVTGILALFSSWCCLGMLLAPLGLVLGAIAFSRAPRGARGLAAAGLTMNGVALAMFIVLQIVGFAMTFWSLPRAAP